MGVPYRKSKEIRRNPPGCREAPGKTSDRIGPGRPDFRHRDRIGAGTGRQFLAREPPIFLDKTRGVGADRRKWGRTPDSTMTDPGMASMVEGGNGRVLSLGRKGGRKQVLVPKDAPGGHHRERRPQDAGLRRPRPRHGAHRFNRPPRPRPRPAAPPTGGRARRACRSGGPPARSLSPLRQSPSERRRRPGCRAGCRRPAARR